MKYIVSIILIFISILSFAQGEFDAQGKFVPQGAYPIADAKDIKGATKQVADLTARDAIATNLRTEGMMVFVVSTQKNYQLKGGVGNGNWVEIPAALADGSETKINAGTNVTVTGSGTVGSPYVINSTGGGGSGWGLNGTSNTNSSLNFIGTTDAQDLVFKSNNKPSFKIKTDGRIAQDSTILASIGTASTIVHREIRPLDSLFSASSWLETQSATKYGAWIANNVYNMGWNISPGGGQVRAGRPGIGMSFEQEFRPDNSATYGLTEFHDWWIKPNGTQIRLKSYTINNNNDDVDFYHTVSRIYFKNPSNVANVWRTIEPGGDVFRNVNNITYTHFVNAGGMGLQPSATGTNYYLNTNWDGVYLPGLNSFATYNQITKSTYPNAGNAYQLGDSGFAFTAGWFNTIRTNTVNTQSSTDLILSINSTERARLTTTGRFGLNTNAPTALLDVNSNTIRIRSDLTPSSSSDSQGNVGDIAKDDNYIYLKTSSGWKRAALSTW
jgi:hypothetical protein